MTPKYSPILWWPPKNIHKIFVPPKKYSFFWNPPKILKFKILNPKKMTRAYVCTKISEYLPSHVVYYLLLLTAWNITQEYKLWERNYDCGRAFKCRSRNTKQMWVDTYLQKTSRCFTFISILSYSWQLKLWKDIYCTTTYLLWYLKTYI